MTRIGDFFMKKKKRGTQVAEKNQAANAYNKWKDKDPYPEIEAALLNSADILAYVKCTSMLEPFDPTKLKGASYDVPIEGKVIYWDENGVKTEKYLIKNGDYFELSPNSIAFVTMQPYFRIPYYLALRFNLKITHIYKGLLLGTGPLVDPGFSGKLSIPLHNLTSNTYRFFKGDELITMEFTKMSKNKLWRSDEVKIGHSEQYIKNDIVSDRTVDDYVAKALKKDRLENVISSIPATMLKSQKAITKAKKTINRIQRWNNVINIAGIVGIVTVVVTALTLTFNAFCKANERYDALMEEYNKIKIQYEIIMDDMQEEIDLLNQEVFELRNIK